jgi:hypothetical protein
MSYEEFSREEWKSAQQHSLPLALKLLILPSRSLGQGKAKPTSLRICERSRGEEVREQPSLVGSGWPGAPGDHGARDTTNRRACSGSPVMVTGWSVSPHTSWACRFNQHLPADPCRMGGWMMVCGSKIVFHWYSSPIGSQSLV